MADPFAFIVDEGGSLSPLKEQQLFHLSSFINNPNADEEEEEEEEEENAHIPSPLPPADAPILICSLPEISTDADEENSNKKKSPSSSSARTTASAKETTESTDISANKKSNRKKKAARRRRTKGTGLKFSDSESIQEDHSIFQLPSQPEPDPEPTVTIAPPGAQKLPETVVAAKPVDTLEKVMSQVTSLGWREPDVTNDDRDLLEIVALKGMHFNPPSWWRPGGYSDDDMPDIW